MEIGKSFIAEIKQLINESRKKSYSAINLFMVEAYWNIGRRIVEEEQKGEAKADYGKRLIEVLAKELTGEFGSGFKKANLWNFRQFYLTFPIRHAVRDQFATHCVANVSEQNQLLKKSYTVRSQLPSILRAELTWTHYRLIMRLENPKAREYYINEAANEGWSTRNLERNIQTLYYERILSTKDKELLKSEADDESRLDSRKPNIRDFIKDPFVFEFLGLPANESYKEQDLEEALITHLRSFLLELGKGFAFIARQQHIRTELSDFYIDLVFYNYELKCFVLIDLKTTKLTHQDIGQMDMYVRMYDELLIIQVSVLYYVQNLIQL